MTKKAKLYTTSAVIGSNGVTPMIPDAADIEALWLDPGMGDGITDLHYHSVPIGKPLDYFRTHPDALYRRRTELLTIKHEGVIGEQFFIVAPAMRGQIEEARPVTLVTVVSRNGSPRLWPINFPKEGGHDNEAWMTARAAAKAATSGWFKLVWTGRSYATRAAQAGYAPDPDFSKLPPFNELVKLAFGEHGIIRDTTHPIYRELFGAPPMPAGKDVDGGDLDI